MAKAGAMPTPHHALPFFPSTEEHDEAEEMFSRQERGGITAESAGNMPLARRGVGRMPGSAPEEDNATNTGVLLRESHTRTA